MRAHIALPQAVSIWEHQHWYQALWVQGQVLISLQTAKHLWRLDVNPVH